MTRRADPELDMAIEAWKRNVNAQNTASRRRPMRSRFLRLLWGNRDRSYFDFQAFDRQVQADLYGDRSGTVEAAPINPPPGFGGFKS